jgi:hypothetical protein
MATFLSKRDPLLKPEQRAYLIEIAQSASVITAIESHIRNSNRRFIAIYSLVVLVAGIAVGSIVVYLQVMQVSGHVLIFTVIGIYTGMCFLFYWVIRLFPERAVFRPLVSCVSIIDSAIGKAPASRPKKAAARRLALCARRMRRYQPLVPLGLYKRTLAQEATRASHALRSFIGPIMLGTDEDLNQVKAALARAAIRIGTSYWTQVGDLEASFSDKSVQRRAALASLLPLLTGVVIPVVAALITALIKP